MKLCKGCTRNLEDSAFRSHTRQLVSGVGIYLATRCRVCENRMQRERAAQDPAKVAEINKRSYQKHVEARRKHAREKQRAKDPAARAAEYKRYYEMNREQLIARACQWSKDNAEHMNARRRATYWEDLDASRAKGRAAYAKNPEPRKRHAAKRRAAKRGVETTLTDQEWYDIIDIYEGHCAYCFCTPDVITIDHVTPITKSGGHTANNVVPACLSCNTSKGNRDLHAWLWRKPYVMRRKRVALTRPEM